MQADSEEGTELATQGWTLITSDQLHNPKPPATEPQFPQLTEGWILSGSRTDVCVNSETAAPAYCSELV